MFLNSAHAEDVDIVISPSEEYQTIVGIGGGMVYYQNWLTAHPNKNVLYDTLFNGLGLSALRMGNWAQEENADLSNDAEIFREGKRRRGNDMFVEMSSWSAPASLKSNNSINGTNGGATKATLKKENGKYVYDQFGAWWKSSLERYKTAGVTPDYISLQNEPDMDATYEGMLLDPEESIEIASYGKALESVYNALQTMNERPKIIGPEPLGIGWNNVQKYVNKLDKSLLDGYCYHFYHSGKGNDGEDRYSKPDNYIEAMQGLYTSLNDKPMFMTENCSMREGRSDDAISIAWLLANTFNINHANAYIHWNIMWGDADGAVTVQNPWDKSKWTNTDGFIVNSDYHGLRHFSKFVPQGYVNIGSATTNDDVVCSAFKNKDGDSFTIVLINKGNAHTANISFPIDPTGKGEIIQTVPAQQIWSQYTGNYTGNDISLPAQSITTITLKNEKPLPTFTWVNPNKDTIWQTTDNHNVECNVDTDFDLGNDLSLFWNPTVTTTEANASSCWSNDEGTFSWKASNVLTEGEEGRWAASNNADEWIEIKLSAPTEISSAIIDETSGIGCQISSYEIQYFNESEWKKIETGKTIGPNYKADFTPVVSDRFRLYVKTSGCININYFAVQPTKKALTPLTINNGTIVYEWVKDNKTTGKGYFTIEKNGTILSRSHSVTLQSKANQVEVSSSPMPIIFCDNHSLHILNTANGKTQVNDFIIKDLQGRTIASGKLVDGDNVFHINQQKVVIVETNGQNHKVIVK